MAQRLRQQAQAPEQRRVGWPPRRKRRRRLPRAARPCGRPWGIARVRAAAVGSSSAAPVTAAPISAKAVPSCCGRTPDWVSPSTTPWSPAYCAPDKPLFTAKLPEAAPSFCRTHKQGSYHSCGISEPCTQEMPCLHCILCHNPLSLVTPDRGLLFCYANITVALIMGNYTITGVL
ncbi:hypothetical protein D3C75_485660 [compost metagenome]